MASPGEFVAEYIVTAPDMNNLPGGVLGYAQVTTAQTGITSETDLTGLSVTVDVVANRRIRVTGVGDIINWDDDAVINGRIYEDATQIGVFARFRLANSAGSNIIHASRSAVVTPSSGSHTYKLTLQAASGSVGLGAFATLPAFILVEDIGPA